MRFPTRPAPPLDNLGDLRAEIDRIDAEMHALLIQRGSIIDRLIAVKGTSASGSAFRPGREASMMRRVAERHRGLLPLDTVEGIWRVIIATFTYVQAPFSVHADISGGDAPMRDSARFHFGFTVPYRAHPTCLAVIEAVAASRGDLGIFRLDPDGSGASTGAAPWWEGLVGAGRPKVIARLPFIERPTHPAGTPVFVVSNPLDDPAAAQRDWVLHATRVAAWEPEAMRALQDLYGEVVARAARPGGHGLLLAVPGGVSTRQLHEALTRAGAAPETLDEIGSHAARFRV
ncbi:chorismate mutase [Methylobacterium sp. J-078]|uniref:chorismate mutase n=1 Tax=Methylobacterium sp. J-078 TaxID=2836657 RepID=UPI001FB9FDFA|nr:chorismate mutase [Methylobacterium sp. J-078]MCJ2045848.1 chorismate mutase [Methylobacterium sp. J-078]